MQDEGRYDAVGWVHRKWNRARRQGRNCDGWGLSRVSFLSHFLDEIVGTGYGDPLYYPTSVANREHVDILTYVNRFLLLIRTFPCKGALSVSMASV